MGSFSIYFKICKSILICQRRHNFRYEWFYKHLSFTKIRTINKHLNTYFVSQYSYKIQTVGSVFFSTRKIILKLLEPSHQHYYQALIKKYSTNLFLRDEVLIVFRIVKFVFLVFDKIKSSYMRIVFEIWLH